MRICKENQRNLNNLIVDQTKKQENGEYIMPKMNEVKIISQEVGKGRQDLNYQEVFKIGDNSLKINIKSDSYDFQCHAKVSWLDRNEHKWNVIHNIHYSNMETRDSLCYMPQARDVQGNKRNLIAEFRADRDKLVSMAQELI